MIKVCKIRIYPNSSQLSLIYGTLGCCRFIKNLYIEKNRDYYEETGKFLSAYDFSKWINMMKKRSEKYEWITKYSSKAIKDAIINEERAFKAFFKKKGGYPKFHQKRRTHKESFFFIKDNIRYTDNPRIIKLPILGKTRITEQTCLPPIETISSGRVVRNHNKFYAVLIYDTEYRPISRSNVNLGIDVGVKNYASISSSDGEHFTIKHFKEEDNYKRIKEKIIELQRVIAHKADINYWRLLHRYLDTHNGEDPCEKYKNIMNGESYNSSQIRRLQCKIRRLHESLSNIRKNFIRKLVNLIMARIKPNSITIENLSISEMIRHDGTQNATLHTYIQESGFYIFREYLINKCMEYGITLRIANKYFASSKTCSNCGAKKKSLNLSDRVYTCEECGMIIDRDMNASINLLNLNDKKCEIFKFA